MATVKLTTPIKAHGEETSVLTLRKPTTPDIREIGMPFAFTGEGTTDIKMQAIARYISKLGSIPMGSVDQLSVEDLSELMGVILGFFGNAPGEQSTN